MRVLEFIRQESALPLRTVLTMAGISGLSNVAILALINVAAEQAANDTRRLQHVVLFAIVVLLFILSQKYIMLTTTSEIERILDRIRLRLADKIRHSDLLTLEGIGRAEIYNCVNRETQTISLSSLMLISGVQSAVLVVFTALYIASLSISAFMLCLLVNVIAVTVHFGRQKKVSRDLHEAAARENQFFESLADVLDGFKEIKVNRARGEDLLNHIREIARSAQELKIGIEAQFDMQYIITQSIFYTSIGAIVFLVPQLSPTFSDVVIKAATAVLFLAGPLAGLVNSVPRLQRANAACENIIALENVLDRAVDPAAVTVPPLSGFQEIRLEGVLFHYPAPAAAPAFSVGPIDLRIPRGELLFIAGGNGSGKSTLIKLLTGLYRPSLGVVQVDGAALDDRNIDAYRQLFSVIFSDYHLFKRLYGLGEVAPGAVEALLKRMEIENKTRLVDSEFETLDLSTGQKKRLALLVAWLEDRPIYVFDEVAADQDPGFRRKFYQEVLPEFKARGKTVVAVTHDDRYYQVADRIIKMEDGRIVQVDPGGGRA